MTQVSRELVDCILLLWFSCSRFFRLLWTTNNDTFSMLIFFKGCLDTNEQHIRHLSRINTLTAEFSSPTVAQTAAFKGHLFSHFNNRRHSTKTESCAEHKDVILNNIREPFLFIMRFSRIFYEKTKQMRTFKSTSS